MKKILKTEKGSITLFVLVSMLFFTMFLATIFTLSTNIEITQRDSINKIKSIYEIGLDRTNEIYNELKKIDERGRAFDQDGNEIEGFEKSWDLEEYIVDDVFYGYAIKYEKEAKINEDGTVSGEVPYYIRKGDTEGYVVSYLDMFRERTDITKLDLRNFNTEKIISMERMFYGCENLKSINLSSFNTSNVKSMGYLFYNNSNLETIVFGENFYTGEVINMQGMFNGCQKIEKIDLNSFDDTSKVTTMAWMFCDCINLTELDLSKFDTIKVNNMQGMFKNCKKLAELDISNFKSGENKVISTEDMFRNCELLKRIEGLTESNFIEKFNISNPYAMFDGCKSLEELNLTGFITDAGGNMAAMFRNCEKLTALDLTSFNTENVVRMEYMFQDCNLLEELRLDNFKINSTTTMTDMFRSYNDIIEIYVSNEAYDTLLENANIIGVWDTSIFKILTETN